MLGENRIKHDSFGVIRFSRAMNSGQKQLFGSTVKTNNTIRLEIAPAVYERGLHRDWIGSNALPFIEVEMSQAQFAEAISSMNIGSGTPVTIIAKNGVYVEQFEEESKFDQFQNEFAEDMKDLQDTVKQAQQDIEELLGKKSVTKADRELIKGHLYHIEQQLRANIPFLYESFNEQVGKSLHEARMEIEAFAQQRAVESMVAMKLDEGSKSIE